MIKVKSRCEDVMFTFIWRAWNNPRLSAPIVISCCPLCGSRLAESATSHWEFIYVHGMFILFRPSVPAT